MLSSDITDTVNPFNPFKILHWSNYLELLTKGVIPAPLSAEIGLTNRCNHNCIFCTTSKDRSNVTLSIEQVKTLVQDLASVGTKSLVYCGRGEPLLHDSFKEILWYVKKEFGLSQGLVTNGSLLANGLIQDAVINCCKFVRISLDSGPKTYKSIRRPNKDFDFDHICETIYELRNNYRTELTIGVSYLAQESNLDDLYETCKKVRGAGASYIQIRPVIPVSETIEPIHGDLLLKAVNICSQLQHDFENEYFKVYGLIDRFGILSKSKNASKCYSNPLVVICDANGDILMPCGILYAHKYPEERHRYTIGNFLTRPFREIWASEEHKTLLSNLNLDECPNCRFKSYNTLIEGVFVKDNIHKDFI